MIALRIKGTVYIIVIKGALFYSVTNIEIIDPVPFILIEIHTKNLVKFVDKMRDLKYNIVEG